MPSFDQVAFKHQTPGLAKTTATDKGFPVTTVGWFHEWDIEDPPEKMATWNHMWDFLDDLKANPKPKTHKRYDEYLGEFISDIPE